MEACYSRDELLYAIALAKQQLREQRRIAAQAYNKGDPVLYGIECKTLTILRRRLHALEGQYTPYKTVRMA